MKRDLDLIRKILFVIEESPNPAPDDIAIDGYDAKQIDYHIGILKQHNLLSAIFGGNPSPNGLYWRVAGLTWDGHEFLEAAKVDSRWEKAKEIILDKTGSFLFESLKQILFDLVMKQLKS